MLAIPNVVRCATRARVLPALAVVASMALPTAAGAQTATGATTVAPPPPTAKARLLSDGTAVAPSTAPAAVKGVIAAGNRIAKLPYRYGGGHASFPRDTGYDCSGSVSYALWGGRLLRSPLASGGFMRWGLRGRGRWISVYAHGGHAYMTVAGLRFDTSGARSSGSRWQRSPRSAAGYVVRHPRGF